MEIFTKLRLIKETKEYVLYDSNEIKTLTVEQLEKIQALKKSIRIENASFVIPFIYIKLIINTLSLRQIKKLRWASIETINAVALYKGNLNELIQKIIRPYREYERFLSNIIERNYTIEQMQFILSNKLLYKSPYHKDFDYDEICLEITELGLSPTKEFANVIDIEAIKRFVLFYSRFQKDQIEVILSFSSDKLFSQNRKQFFETICDEDNEAIYTFSELIEIIEYKRKMFSKN